MGGSEFAGRRLVIIRKSSRKRIGCVARVSKKGEGGPSRPKHYGGWNEGGTVLQFGSKREGWKRSTPAKGPPPSQL